MLCTPESCLENFTFNLSKVIMLMRRIVEGYLRGRGLEIPPLAEFITAELDLSEFRVSNSITSSDSGMNTSSPKTPDDFIEKGNHENGTFSHNFDPSKPGGNAFPFPIEYADWAGDTVSKDARHFDSTSSAISIPSFNISNSATSEQVISKKRLVMINVEILLEGKSLLIVCVIVI